MITESTTP